MRVTLFVWAPVFNLNLSNPLQIINKISLGHAALRTYVGGPTGNGIYASYWPGRCRGWHQHLVDDERIHSSVRERLCLEDKSHNHSDPDAEAMVLGQSNARLVTFELDLDVNRINAKFEEFMKGDYQWHVFGSSIFRNEKMQTCSGLCYSLLIEGGAILPKYPLADFYSDIGLVNALIRVFTLTHKYGFHYVHIPRCINTAVRQRQPYLRAVGGLLDSFSGGPYISLLKLSVSSYMLGYAEWKFNKDEIPGKLISLPIILIILINIARYYVYDRTITPADIANIGEALQQAKDKRISSSQTYYSLPRFGLIKRSSINNTLSLLFAATELFFFIKSESGPLAKAIEHSFFQWLAAKYCIYNNSFLLISGLRGLYYFATQGRYGKSHGLLGTMADVTENDCGKDTFLPLGIFLYYLPVLWSKIQSRLYLRETNITNSHTNLPQVAVNPVIESSNIHSRNLRTYALITGGGLLALGIYGVFKYRNNPSPQDSVITASIRSVFSKHK